MKIPTVKTGIRYSHSVHQLVALRFAEGLIGGYAYASLSTGALAGKLLGPLIGAMPIKDITIAMPIAAHTSIGLRPKRSASRPHNGAVMAVPKNVALNATADHLLT